MLAEPANIPGTPEKEAEYILISGALHAHPFCEMFLCGEGTLIVETEKQNILLHSGEVLIIPPNFYHRVLDCSVNGEWGTVSFSC